MPTEPKKFTDREFVSGLSSPNLFAASLAVCLNEQLALQGRLPTKLARDNLREAKNWMPLYHAEIARRFCPAPCCCPKPIESTKPMTAVVMSSECQRHGQTARPDLWRVKR